MGMQSGMIEAEIDLMWLNLENGSLDVSFGEDNCRIRKGFGAENVSRLRRMALNLLKQEETAKCGIKAKQHKAGWDEQYMLKVLKI